MFKNWRFAVELKSLSVIQLKQPTDELLGGLRHFLAPKEAENAS